MTLQPAESFWAYREQLRQLMRPAAGGARAAEPRADYTAERGPAPLDERLVQAIWAHQMLRTEGLRTLGGEPIRVLEPGRWNGGKGPDFLQARLWIGPRLAQGDVEVHLHASDWDRHGHGRDLDYNGLVLHVVLRADDGRTHDRLHNGTLVPRLELEPYVFPDLDTVRRSLTPDDYPYDHPDALGRCYEWMIGAPPTVVADFLDRAGDERLLAKMRRLEELTPQDDPEQMFYQALMTALGSGGGRTLYYLLAKRTPLRETLEEAKAAEGPRRADLIEALLLHVAGLVPPAEDPAWADAPPEARTRAETLQAQWRPLAPYWADRVIAPTRRWFQGVRPPNFPTRRLAGVAALLARALERGRLPLEDLTGRLRAAAPALEQAVPARRRHPALDELVAWFVVRGEGRFWGQHYSFTARPAARAMDLIGEATALSLVFNALLPAALLAARRAGDERLGQAVHRLYALFPPLAPNQITRFMTRRLFGEDGRGAALLTTERRYQGLFQIFHACCRSEPSRCDQCYYLTPDA